MSADYLATVGRIEPDVHPLDRDGALASIAVSLKRIADALERLSGKDDDVLPEGILPTMMRDLDRCATGLGQ